MLALRTMAGDALKYDVIDATFKRDFWIFFAYDQCSLNAIWRLTLRHVLTESLEIKILCENIAFVLINKI